MSDNPKMSRGGPEYYREIAAMSVASRELKRIERQELEGRLVAHWLAVGKPKLEAKGIVVVRRHWPKQIRRYAPKG